MKNKCKFAVIIVAMTMSFYGCSPNDYLEKYEFNIGKSQLIKMVEDFKANNKNYVPPSSISPDSYDTLTLRFNAYIYYPKENSVVYFFIDNDPDTPDKSTINLVSVNEGLHEGKYKIINKDFNHSKNSKLKKEFEERFLTRLRLDYKDKGKGVFYFNYN